MALRADIADLNHGLARKLLLDVEIVVLHVRSLDIAVVGEGVALAATRRSAGGKERRRVLHRVGAQAGRKDSIRVRPDVVESGAWGVGRRIGKVAQHHVLRGSVKEHAEAGTDHGLAFTSNVPGDAGARGEVFLVGIVEAAQAGLTDLREGKGSP